MMFKRSIPLLLLFTACAGGESEESPSSFSASFTASMGGDGDGDGDGDDDPGDGDADTTPGDGDTGDGDADTTPGDGDGDSGDGDGEPEDPCVLKCDGKIDSTPNTCDGPYFIGRTAAKGGFFFGGNTGSATDDENGACGPVDIPVNLDQGPDHFFRIWLVQGDTITVTQNPNNWVARLKIHDEAECVGNAKVCSETPDPATIEYEALKTDWFTIVADGRNLALGDAGDYTLMVDLEVGPNLDECSCL
ncbi:hypothetical protein [Enhygromyxa salina]|nr:hypothetical protein [Enhygromyxa salina]